MTVNTTFITNGDLSIGKAIDVETWVEGKSRKQTLHSAKPILMK